ncbi:hypothetical protein R6L23_11180 [Streptomyces sp. SR27]|nr:hypothetical protein [Streptomyces sp. SR27]
MAQSRMRAPVASASVEPCTVDRSTLLAALLGRRCLYREEARRIGAALEFHARYQLGATPPKWLCGGKVVRTMGPDVEVALNHLEGRMGMKLPQTETLAASRRPGGADDLFVAWEALTHASSPTPA